MSTLQDLTSATIARRWKLAGGSVIAAVPDQAVLIQRGEHASADLLREVFDDHGLEVTDVRIDLGAALPAIESVAVAVILDGETGDVDRGLVGWIAEADAAGVAIFAIGSRELLEPHYVHEAVVRELPTAKPAADKLFDAFLHDALAA
jgi:hypothetical protein